MRPRLIGLASLVAAAAVVAPLLRPAPVGASIAGVRWQVAWEGVEDGLPAPFDAAGGATITLTSVSLTERSLSLVPCPEPPPVGVRLASLLVPAAWADHAPWDDPSQVQPHAVLSAHPGERAVGETGFKPRDYCQVHWLVAPAGSGTPSPPDRSASTLRVRGSWTDAEGIVRPFDHDTRWTQADLLDLPGRPGGPWCADVTLHRDLAGALTTVDPAQDALVVQWALLEGLKRATTAEVALQPATTGCD